jgi:DNA-binding MarR family transcriptional regulator
MISSLQENILCLALKKRFITCEEILTELWNWKDQEQGTISKAQYASAHAALSRSLTRLWEKGLIEYWKTLTRYRTGITLTPEGEALAQAILAEAEEVPVDG